MIRVADFVNALSLRTLSPSTKTEWPIETADFNRPGLQLAGHFDYFAQERPQVIGKAEMAYLDSMDSEKRAERLNAFFSYDIPCVIICRGMQPQEEMLISAKQHDVPVFQTDMITTRFSMNLIIYMRSALAPRATLHGVLMDVYGVGVLITGRSSVGKSEAALELIKRGHQLVAEILSTMSGAYALMRKCPPPFSSKKYCVRFWSLGQKMAAMSCALSPWSSA